MTSYEIIKKPIITEKTSELAKKGVYTFEVGISATAGKVKEGVESLFGVKVSSVRILVGKKERRHLPKSRRLVSSPNTKKAYVTIEKGKSIDLFDVTKK